MIYAGIGSRQTPLPILADMEELAQSLADSGHTLSSGGALGADTAFERGCDEAAGRKRVFLPSYPVPSWAIIHAAQHHPAWHRCATFAHQAHARNSLIMLGSNGHSPVSLVICWTPGGLVTGGTGQALRIAAALHIPVYNLALHTPSEILHHIDFPTDQEALR